MMLVHKLKGADVRWWMRFSLDGIALMHRCMRALISRKANDNTKSIRREK